MAVARRQIEELAGILTSYMTLGKATSMVLDLQGTEAYRANQSFRETVDRLVEVLRKKGE